MNFFHLIFCLSFICLTKVSAECTQDKRDAWYDLESVVDSGYVFSSIEWYNENCQWKLIKSPLYQIERFIFPQLKSFPLQVKEQWAKVEPGPLESTVQSRVNYLESFGYFKVNEVVWRRDSLRQVLYPVLITQKAKASQASILLLSQGEGLQSSLEVELKNIRSSLNDVGVMWVQWLERRELSGYFHSHMLHGSFWSFMPSFRYDQRDSTLERLELVAQVQYRPMSSWSYGFQVKRVQGESMNKWFKWDESVLGVLWGNRFRQPGKFRHLLNVGVGQGEFESQEKKYFFQEGENDVEVVRDDIGLSIRYFHGFYINIQDPILNGLGFYLDDPNKMRLAPHGYLYSNYFGGALEAWWYIQPRVSLGGVVEYDEWEELNWQNDWGPGIQLNIKQESGLGILVSWIFPWQSQLENSRINLGITSRF